MKKPYSVHVSNVGKVDTQISKHEALKSFDEYVELSVSGEGEYACEDVTLLDAAGETVKLFECRTALIEVTDTLGGDANYTWLHRYTLHHDTKASDLMIVRRVKKLIGWSGVRCRVYKHGDMIELRPYGMHQVCFINWTV